MATGFDELVDYLLSEIALCGVQGAGSADFCRFIQTFYSRTQPKEESAVTSKSDTGLPPGGLGRIFYERIWDWVSTHSDIRIIHKNESRHYSLSDFEAAELGEAGATEITGATSIIGAQSLQTPTKGTRQPSKFLLEMREALRERLSKEGHDPRTLTVATIQASTSIPSRRSTRNIPKRPRAATPIFDEPESTTTAPRMYASQNRVWQALTGHGTDLKKVPSMEFALLSLIAARGVNGITQPDLTRLSGQDKRSVPHRTNELVRKGYIVKNPVQAGKIRTSLCVHTKFISQGHFLSSGAVEDVYQEGTFVLSGFVQLLYSKLKSAGIVPTRNIRKKLGVPMTTWNKRATQGALIRLDQTGMIKRFRVRKKHSEDSWATCIQVLREPREEDVNNLGFRRQPTAMDETVDELLDEDVDGDTLMRDLEVDMMDNDDVEASNNADPQNALKDFGRIPPQWSPDRFLANLVYDAVALGGANGLDAGMLRDRIVGPFWRRPLETYVTRMSDDWEKVQPLSLRHLAIIRDTRNTQEKKFIHYVYRTYQNFQKAVEIGEVHWEGVSKAVPKESTASKQGRPKKNTTTVAALNAWGFPNLNTKDLVRSDGSATLSEARSAIVHPRKYGPRWDNALTQKIGYEKADTPVAKPKILRAKSGSHQQENGVGSITPSPRAPKMTKSKIEPKSKSMKKTPKLSLTPEQRISLGLKPNGRLSKSAGQQILAHRQQTGDPTSIPDKIEEEPFQRGQQLPLMTAEERIAQGLPAKGRLGIAVENKIRAERGLAKIQKKTKKVEKKLFKEPALLSKEQRLAFGWKGHGRLPQDLIDGLREERENGISLEDSTVLPKYMDIMKAKAMPTVPREPDQSEEDYTVSLEEHPSSAMVEDDHGQVPVTVNLDVTAPSSFAPVKSGKRKAQNAEPSSHTTKKQRTATTVSREENARPVLSSSSILLDDTVASVPTPNCSRSGTPMLSMDNSKDGATFTPTYGVDANRRLVHPAHPPEDVQHTTPLTSPNTRTLLSSSIPSVLVQPDASSLELQDRAKFAQYMNRSAPGLYVNHFARHKSRGRPRKAYIATFKLPRLQEYDWFTPDQSLQQDALQYTGTDILEASQKDDSQLNENNNGPPLRLDSTSSGMVLQPTSAFTTEELHTLLQDTEAEGHPSITTGSATPMPARLRGVHNDHFDEQAQSKLHAKNPSLDARALETVAVLGDKDEEVQKQPLPGVEQARHTTESVAVLSQVEKEMNSEQLSVQELPTAAANNPSEVSPEPSLQQTLPWNRTADGWATINTSLLHNPLPYQSPYGPSLRSDSTPPSQTAVNVEGTDVSVTSASRPRTPLGEENEHVSLPEGVYSAISEVQTPPLPKLKPRAKKDHPMEGSGLLFRRQIIREIIDLCKGVFPDSGEIGRPFHKLWVERHGHKENVKEPIASTVNSTMRNMCINPKFGLKRMVFLVKNKYGPSTSEKAMITYSHFTPRSPEVLQLAYKIANFSLEKSHQYFPEEIRHLVDDTSLYYPVRLAPKNESIVLNQLNPELETHIKEAQKRRRKELAQQRKMENRARKAQNAQVEAPPKRGEEAIGAPHTKRARLASLNDKNKRYRRVSLQKAKAGFDDENQEQENEDPDAAATEHAGRRPLIWTRPWITPTVDRGTADYDGESSSETEVSDDEPLDSPASETHNKAANDHDLSSLKHSAEEAVLINNTVSAGPERTTPTNENADRTENPTDATVAQKGKKRVRIAGLSTQRLQKRARQNIALASGTPSAEAAHNLSTQSDVSSLDAEEEPDNEAVLQTKTRKRLFWGRQRGKPGPLPTLLERLTGLTGDPNDPIYQPPTRKQRAKDISQPWSEKKKKKHQANKVNKQRRYTAVLDPVDRFNKICCTLVIASSMLGEDGLVDWRIVEKVYSDDKFFDVARTRRLWTWMQSNMATQLAEFTTTFQTSFLEAYADGKFAAIEDPETYEWASVVRWAMRYGVCPELPLPVYRESLRQFVVDESSYEILDRLNWYQKKIANRVRTELQLHYTFTAPLQRPHRSDWSSSDKVIKARSWVRANTATPQALYSGNQAHDKLMELGTPILTSIVGDYVEKQSMRMRQLKRLLPGRNYTFTRAFAKKFVRPFELADFLAAVKAKKDMDTAFAKQDSEQRYFNISRSEQDGAVAAILSLVSEGKVKLVPQLPSVNNEFGAPLPRLSVWGFCEGDYIHRAIDRDRLFWDIHVVPTPGYEFGNPLQPLPSPLGQPDTGESSEWPPLPDPPLPGKNDRDALLPIWSSIDGQSITWPWWYRILNLVLQPLIFQPGATTADIHAHCPEHTTEMFEIELVLNWLESVNGVSRLSSGGYVTKPGFWAAFGDKLLDSGDDWFGEHVKRKAKNHEKQKWREHYNRRHLTLHQEIGQQADDNSLAEEETGVAAQIQSLDEVTRKQILQHPKRQYRIVQQALDSPAPQPQNGNANSAPSTEVVLNVQEQSEGGQTADVERVRTSVAQTSEIRFTTSQHSEFSDAEGEDTDAEGEVDDAIY